MSNTTNESEDRIMSKDCIDSPSVEEASSGGSLVGGGALKKGPWTSAEDAILVNYVNKHGEGNWNAVQKHSGLFRCGKSCRLRWANHLRPDLKKGAFTQEEERRIIELHAKMGNKWARMAAELPGRTDNEIKNYWNTRIKRRQRAGLPIYPPDVCLQALNESQQSQTLDTFPTGEMHQPDLFQTTSFEIPEVEFRNLEPNQWFLSCLPTLLDSPASSMLTQGLDSSHGYSSRFPTMHPPKRLRESDTPFPCLNGRGNNVFSEFDQYDDDAWERIVRPFRLSSPYDPDINNKKSPLGVLPGSHALLNGNSSSSEPIFGAVKLELPSLQYSETQLGSWDTPLSPLPLLESDDILIQSPPTEQTHPDCVSPRSSGLLEAVLYESRTLKSSKINSCQKTLITSALPGDAVENPNVCETEWEVCGDPISPLGHSAASVFSEYTPISGSSSEEPQSVETRPECKVNPEAIDWVSTQYDGKKEISNQMDFSRPDALLGLDWFWHGIERGKEQSIRTDAIGALLGEDFCRDYKQMGAVPATSSQGCSLGSYAWNTKPTVSQLSENH